jgi:hypothetical protein
MYVCYEKINKKSGILPPNLKIRLIEGNAKCRHPKKRKRMAGRHKEREHMRE